MESSEATAQQLSGPERALLEALAAAKDAVALAALGERAGVTHPDQLFSYASWLQRKGLVELTETVTRSVRVAAEGRSYAEHGFPEDEAYALVRPLPDGATLEELRRQLGQAKVSIALAWWKRKGLGSIEKRGNETVLRAGATNPSLRELEFLRDMVRSAPVPLEAARARDTQALDALRSRPGVLDIEEAKDRSARLTDLGREVAQKLASTAAGIGELTPELVKSGAWKSQPIRPYDIRTEAPRVASGKPHPLGQLIEEIRTIFVELGFQEIEEDYVHSAFWNLDALFIPQDHPARDMQDTFYLSRPAKLEVPEDLLEKVSGIHKDGGSTHSRGWGAPLDPEESRRALLRTHTTVGTIRYLAKNPKPPTRVFSIGRVFRKETMDATHLPEFHQIEGIATEEGADFPMLLGILQEFYRRLGFPKLRWRPAYFPYTEPSMEVEVWTGTRWMELGGCGIFRPEVTLPLGVRTPVLAWGLGLERLAMMRFGLKDIRDLYVSDLEWLRSHPLL